MKKTNTQKSSKILTNLIEKSRQNSVSLPSKSKIPIIDNKIYYFCLISFDCVNHSPEA